MYAVIYRWRVKPGTEEIFRQAWREVTEEIRAQYGGGGSRLHKADNGEWIAYARWPSKAARDRAFTAFRKAARPTPAMKMWPQIAEEIGETWLEIKDDDLIPEIDLPPPFHRQG